MTGTAIGTSGGGGKIGNKAFVKGGRGVLLYVVREDVAQALADKDGELTSLTVDSLNRLYVRDSRIEDVITQLALLGQTNSLIQTLTEGITVLNALKVQTRTVSCPFIAATIQGIGASAETAGDCMGTVTMIKVPTSGIIQSATFWDLSDQGSQVDLEIFRHSINITADNAAWSPTDEDMRKFVTELAFFSFDDHLNSQTSELRNIGKGYTAPEGKLYIQAVCRGTPTIAAGSEPRFQLQILSDDPDWQEF